MITIMNKQHLLAHWCHCGNFGDALNPYLLKKLTGRSVRYCNTSNPHIKQEVLSMIWHFLHLKKYDFRRMSSPIFDKPVLLCIGSIMSRSHSNYLIWGAGYMDSKEQSGGGCPYVFRGPYSSRKFQDEGHAVCDIYGDPALLLPLVYTPHVVIKKHYAIIPHLSEYKKLKKIYPTETIISLNDNIEKIVTKICSCEYIISTSLHGVIVAHAYGIPAIWVQEGYIYTDGIKFWDYFASVGIPRYNGVDFKLQDFIYKRYADFSDDIKTYMLPHRPVLEIQRRILQAAPFNIKTSILEKVNLAKMIQLD